MVENNHTVLCSPGLLVEAINIYSYLKWIKSHINDEMCLNDSFREDFKDFVPIVSVPVLMVVILICIRASCRPIEAEKEKIRKIRKISLVMVGNQPKSAVPRPILKNRESRLINETK